MLKRFVLSLLSSLIITACSSPKAGDECSGAEGVCESALIALSCEHARYREFQCRGSRGCSEDSGNEQVLCDFGDFLAGDACPVAFESRAWCDVSNIHQALRCRNGTMKAEACQSCVPEAEGVRCQR